MPYFYLMPNLDSINQLINLNINMLHNIKTVRQPPSVSTIFDVSAALIAAKWMTDFRTLYFVQFAGFFNFFFNNSSIFWRPLTRSWFTALRILV